MKNLIKALPLLLITVVSHAAYEDHFPTYYEYCASSKWKLQDGREGGQGGHGFTYIHGLCKDYRYEYPQVIPCSEVTASLKAKYPHEGVGVSLDGEFKNVKWVAVPGRELTLFGDLERKSAKSTDIESIIDRITELKVFNGVVHGIDETKDMVLDSDEYLRATARETMGTDHSVNLARSLDCVKLPFQASKLPAVAEYLNAQNLMHKEKADYVWSMMKNNCVHLAANQAFTLGIFNKKLETNQNFIKTIFNMAIPANFYMTLADQTVLQKMPSNKLLAGVIPENDFHPVQVGAVIEHHPAFPSGDRFDTDNTWLLASPRLTKPGKIFGTPEKYRNKYLTPFNSEIKANAEMWVGRYERLLNELTDNQKGSEVESYLVKQLELSKKILEQE